MNIDIGNGIEYTEKDFEKSKWFSLEKLYNCKCRDGKNLKDDYPVIIHKTCELTHDS